MKPSAMILVTISTEKMAMKTASSSSCKQRKNKIIFGMAVMPFLCREIIYIAKPVLCHSPQCYNCLFYMRWLKKAHVKESPFNPHPTSHNPTTTRVFKSQNFCCPIFNSCFISLKFCCSNFVTKIMPLKFKLFDKCFDQN